MARQVTISWVLAFFCLQSLCGQATFQKQLDGLNGLFCLEQTPNDTYWLGTFLGKIIRLDANGQWLGAHTLQKGDTASTRFIYDLERTPNGGVWALYDRNNINTALDDYLILARLSADGIPLWQTPVHYGEVLHWAHNRMSSDPAGNAYVVSARFSAPGGVEPSRIIFVKVAPDGTLQWSKSYFNNGVNHSRALQRLSDGSFLLCGNGQLASQYGFLLRLSPDGEALWSRRYNRFLFKAFAELPDGGWVFAATEAGPLPQNVCVLRLAADGNIVWAKRLAMPNALNWLPGLSVSPAGDVLVFNYETPKDQPVADMICLSANGDFRWAKRYDLCHNYGISAGIITNDNGIASIRYRAGGHLFLKTDIEGNCAACPAEDVIVSLENLSDLPLPFNFQTETRTPPFPATTDFLPFNVSVNDFCGKEKPVTGISLVPNELCVFQPLFVAANGPGLADSYEWFFPGGTPASTLGYAGVSGIEYDMSGMTTVTLVATTGFCRDTFLADLTVNPGPAPLALGADTTVCGSNVSLQLDATTNGASDYFWNDGDTSALRAINSSGEYIVTASNGACETRDTIRVEVLESLVVTLPNDTTICGADTIWLDATTQNAESYLWNDGYDAPRRPVTEQGYYAVTAFRDNCSASDFLSVNFFPRPPALPFDTLVCENEAVTFTVGESLAGEIRWNGVPGHSEFTFEDTGWVHRTVEFRQCRFEDSTYVRRADCRDGFAYFAPNVFSPDGDGENDFFEIFGDDLEVLVFQAFDRWGNLTFETKNENLARWNGASKGRSLQPGVYGWVARVRQRGREGWIAGDVLLLR